MKLVEAFKEELRKRGLHAVVRANKCGCMDICEIGPNVLIHPDNIWYMKVRLEDIGDIVESHLLNNQPVARLLSDFSQWGK